MSGKVPSRVRITRTQRNTPKYGGNPMSAGLISCGFGRNRVICQKIKSRTAAVTPPRPKSPITDLNFLKTIDLWSAGGSNQATVVSQFGAIGDWDTSAVTNMAEAFKNGRNSTLGGTLDTTTFNEDISGWNTAAVTNMSSMFNGAAAFNQNINGWNTAAVTDMSSMFNGAAAFNQNINGWNTAAVTDMSSMFKDTNLTNAIINALNTISVTNMSNMFRGTVQTLRMLISVIGTLLLLQI